MTVATALVSANRYYCQPLLADMARTLHLTSATAGLVPTFTQGGIAFGLVLFVPLGDMVERRRLIVSLAFAVAFALSLTVVASNTTLLLTSALLIGMFASVSQLIVGLAASLALPSQRGRAVGTVTAGLLIGVLMARTVAGMVGGIWGWRTMYLAAAIGMATLGLMLALALPRSRPTQVVRYRELLSSLILLIREKPELRESAVLGALAFAAMNAFWTTLVFFIAQPPYHYGTTAAGLFGLAGIGGALAAPLIGHITDRSGPRFADFIALNLGVLSFILLFVAGRHLAGLIVGIVLLDLATQTNLVSNQTRIYSLVPEAANRLNTVFMSSYFVGGAVGAGVGALVWNYSGWFGLCALGAILFALALFVLLRGQQFALIPERRPGLPESGHGECSD